ncbi:MAG: DapH/DapD/GlmU-related protein [Planctomycetota bacterium]
MSDCVVVHPGVEFLGEHLLEEFVIVGKPYAAEVTATTIGDDAQLRSHSVIYAGTCIGRGFRTGHGIVVREATVIGDGVSIGTGSVVEHHVRIGDGVRLHSNVFVPEYSELRDGCWLGPNVVVTNAKYPQSPRVKEELRGATICEGAIVGANATLLPGVTLGEGCVVGAGAVVVEDVPPGAVVVGNPAHRIKTKDSLPYA